MYIYIYSYSGDYYGHVNKETYNRKYIAILFIIENNTNHLHDHHLKNR